MRRSTGKRLWAEVCGALPAAVVLSGCAESDPASKGATVQAATGEATQTAAETEDRAGEQAVASAAYPEKEIQRIVTAMAGGGTDAMARAVCAPLERTLGRATVITSDRSASGLVDMGDILQAAVGRHTLGVFLNTDVVNFVYGVSECDLTTDDFTYIAGLNTTGDVLALKKGSNMKSLDDFVSKAEEKPGESTITLLSAIQNLSPGLMNEKMGVVTTGAVYESGNRALTDLLGGHIETGILSVKFISQAQEQDLTVLGIMLGDRLGTSPDISTFSEQGCDIVNPAVRVPVGPKGLPESVVNVLVGNLKQGYKGEARESVSNIDEEPAPLTGADLDTFLREDFAIREATLKK